MTGGNQMNKFYMNGKLIHKASDHNTKRCEVEKWVFLPHSDFERLKANPYQEHEAITAARDLMYEGKEAYHYPINAKSASNIFARYQDAYNNDAYEVILVFCDTDKAPYREYSQIKNKAEVLAKYPTPIDDSKTTQQTKPKPTVTLTQEQKDFCEKANDKKINGKKFFEELEKFAKKKQRFPKDMIIELMEKNNFSPKNAVAFKKLSQLSYNTITLSPKAIAIGDYIDGLILSFIPKTEGQVFVGKIDLYYNNHGTFSLTTSKNNENERFIKIFHNQVFDYSNKKFLQQTVNKLLYYYNEFD